MSEKSLILVIFVVSLLCGQSAASCPLSAPTTDDGAPLAKPPSKPTLPVKNASSLFTDHSVSNFGGRAPLIRRSSPGRKLSSSVLVHISLADNWCGRPWQESYVLPTVWQPPPIWGSSAMNAPTSGPRSEKTLLQGAHPYQLYSLGSLSLQGLMMLEGLAHRGRGW